MRDSFIRYFQDHFIASQEEMGGYIPGLFSIVDQPDRFCWTRGFIDMASRSHFLPAFYGGAVWKEFGPAANEMMLEWHEVYLLKPYGATILATDDKIFRCNKFVVSEAYQIRKGQQEVFAGWYQYRYKNFFARAGIDGPMLWRSDMRKNDFPRLPVIQRENLFMIFSMFENENVYRQVNPLLIGMQRELGDVVENVKRVLLKGVE